LGVDAPAHVREQERVMSYRKYTCPNCNGHPRNEGGVCDVCEGDGTIASGHFETFFMGAHCEAHPNGSGSCHECAMNSGWYWHACEPGCLPDGEASGPFESEEKAIEDAIHG
jgi:hypothetical protein